MVHSNHAGHISLPDQWCVQILSQGPPARSPSPGHHVSLLQPGCQRLNEAVIVVPGVVALDPVKAVIGEPKGKAEWEPVVNG